MPELNRTDADVTLLAIRNRAMYQNAVTDPVFKSTTHRSDSSGAYFTSDLTTGVIGCIEYYQWCNGPKKCSSPSGLYSITDDFATTQLQFNPVQMATFKTLMRTAYVKYLLTTLQTLLIDFYR
jgi:hypothetical protein